MFWIIFILIAEILAYFNWVFKVQYGQWRQFLSKCGMAFVWIWVGHPWSRQRLSYLINFWLIATEWILDQNTLEYEIDHIYTFFSLPHTFTHSPFLSNTLSVSHTHTSPHTHKHTQALPVTHTLASQVVQMLNYLNFAQKIFCI